MKAGLNCLSINREETTILRTRMKVLRGVELVITSGNLLNQNIPQYIDICSIDNEHKEVWSCRQIRVII